MIRFEKTVREARIPGILGRACPDAANVRRQSPFERMVDVMLELGFAGQDCDANMLRLRRFTDAEIERHGEAAAREATKRAVRRV